MNQRFYLLKGTFLLTLAGLLAKTAGFFYKIFLSRTIGAAEIGRYQLTLPVYAFCIALSCGGIQTAISRFVAGYCAEKDEWSARRTFLLSALLSCTLACVCAAALFFGSSRIAVFFLLEPSCSLLLKIISFSLPFAALHGCMNGYFIGKKKVAVSAASQLAEQLLRIGFVVAVFFLFQKNGRTPDSSIMAFGQLAGEIAAALFCMYHLFRERELPVSHAHPTGRDMKKILSVSMPLGINRMLLCVLQGIEAALLPQMLGFFGHNAPDALAVYGTLTGMALPLILFPTAVTGSLGTLLLPAISEDRALGHEKKIAATAGASFQGSLLLGYFFLTAFLLFGREIGSLLFHSSLAGTLTQKLALLCPFLYINTTLVNILHGLDKTIAASVWNVTAFCIRLYFILTLVPRIGIDGYLLGMLLGQSFITACSLFTLHRQTHFSVGLTEVIIKPGMICIVAGAFFEVLKILPGFRTSPAALLLLAVGYTTVFLFLSLILLCKKEDRQRLLTLRKN